MALWFCAKTHSSPRGRQHRHRAGADASQFRQTGGIFKHVDRIELNPTDREKLL